MFNLRKKTIKLQGFTLAEVIITMGIIGIIAAIVLPMFITNVNQHVFDEARDIGLKKITAAMNQMKTNGDLEGYATNEDFANEFQKYMKFGKRCTSANLSKCFVSKFLTGDNKEINLSNLTKGTDLGQTTNTSSLVGIGLIDGTNIILSYKPNCEWINPYNNTSDTTSCMAAVYDVNGEGKPNKIGVDIGLLNATISTCDGKTLGGLCISLSDITYSPISEDPYNSDNNAWAGAKQACADLEMRLPSLGELGTMCTNKATLGISTGYYWSSDPYGTTAAYYKYFGNCGQNHITKDTKYKALCVK